MIGAAVAPPTAAATYLLYLVVGIAALVVGAAGALAYRNAIGKSTVRQLNELLDATNANFARVDRERKEAQQQIAELQGQIKVLRESVTQRAAVDELARVEMEHHQELMKPLKRLVEIAEATARASSVRIPPGEARPRSSRASR